MRDVGIRPMLDASMRLSNYITHIGKNYQLERGKTQIKKQSISFSNFVAGSGSSY